MRRPMFLTLAAAAALAAAPAWAENAPNTPAPAPPSAGNAAEIGTATISPSNIPPSERNPLLTDNGDVRIGKLIGSDIYNKEDKKIGSVDDVLATPGGQLQVVVATNNKRVAVPWDKIQLGDAKLNSHNKVLMLNETQQSLNGLPAYTPQKQDQNAKKG